MNMQYIFLTCCDSNGECTLPNVSIGIRGGVDDRCGCACGEGLTRVMAGYCGDAAGINGSGNSPGDRGTLGSDLNVDPDVAWAVDENRWGIIHCWKRITSL